MVLETVLLGHHHVAALVLGHLDLPLPGGGSGPGVDVDVDLVAGVGGWDPHVLASVGATDGGWAGSPGVTDGQGVSGAVSDVGAMKVGMGRGGVDSIGDRSGQDHRVKINSQFTHLRVGFTECVGAGVLVCGGGVGAHERVGVVGAAGVSAGDGEHAAHSEGGGAGPGGGAALACALAGREAGAVVAVVSGASVVGEGDHIEDTQHLLPPRAVCF